MNTFQQITLYHKPPDVGKGDSPEVEENARHA
jgi:hypothetical protein